MSSDPSPAPADLLRGGSSFYLDVAQPGILDSLQFRPAPRRDLRPGEMEIAVAATGLNFSDVLKAMGLYPGVTDNPVPLGAECAGRVSRVGEGVEDFREGDEVLAVAPYSFGAYAVTAPYLVQRKPAHLTFEEAATIPVAFMTAHYALNHLGHVAEREKVLIHAAAGGVGLAAIQLCHLVRAEVFATAGSQEKWDHVRAAGVQHVMSSRSLAFADEVMQRTGGKGVDLVLNSLAGEAITKSLGVLGAYGRFLEIGKIDIYQNKPLGLLPFQNNLSYYAIDMDRIFRQRPALVRTLFAEVMRSFEDRALQPLPRRVFPAAEVQAAFRYMAQRKNIGKVVVAMDAAPPLAAPAAGDAAHLNGLANRVAAALNGAAAAPPPTTFREDASYLITGGLGGLGLAVARWMVAQGARNLVLVARREPSGPAADVIKELEAAGAKVLVGRADVAKEDEIGAVLAEAGESLPPLRGVFHAAGVLDDALLTNLDAARFEAVCAPKMEGAWNLHTLTRDAELDCFVLFSSVASVLGSPGQGNYAAANAFLDGLAQHRRALGLPCLSVNWGPWADVGMAAQGDRSAHLGRLGMRLIPPAEGVQLLGRLLQGSAAQAVAMPADWSKLRQAYAAAGEPLLLAELKDAGKKAYPRDTAMLKKLFAAPVEERKGHLAVYFQNQLAKVMGTEPERIDVQQPLSTLGIDSLMGLELMNRVQAGLGVTLTVEMMTTGPSLEQLAEHVLTLIKEPSELEDGAAASAGPLPISLPALAGSANGNGVHAEYPKPAEAAAPAQPEPVRAADLGLDARAYGAYARPLAVHWLEKAGLDKTYVRAEGDRLWYEEDGKLVEVLDLLGGYGSTLFGHNNAELTAFAESLLKERVPVHTQTSNRGAAGMLGYALSEVLKPYTGCDYVVTFASTGTETIEAALKHAVLEQSARAKARANEDARNFALLVHARRHEERELPEPIRKKLRTVLRKEPPRDLASAQRLLAERNARLYEASPLFVALQRSFHGKTSGALHVTANPEYRKPFERINGLRTAWVEPGDRAGLKKQVRAETKKTFALRLAPDGGVELAERPWCNVAALFVEPVQGEGGVYAADPAFLAEIQETAKQHGFPIVVDEIQSGMGRCGTFTASERLGLRGHYYTFAKSLGGGLAKVGALVVERDRYQAEFGTLHTSTFAEDDYGCLIALKGLEILFRDDLPAKCAAKGDYLLGKLRELQTRYPGVIRDVRGLGLLVGVEMTDLQDSPSSVIRMLAAQGVMGYAAAGYLLNEEGIRVGATLSAGNTIRLEPSAYVREEDLDRTVEAMGRLCEVLARANAARLGRYLVERVPAKNPPDDWRTGRTAPVWQEPPAGEPRVAFLTHFIEAEHLAEWDPSLAELPRARLETYFRKTFLGARPFIGQQCTIESATGERVHLLLISFLITSKLIKEVMESGETDWLIEQIQEAVALARKAGCTVVGFGGYLSIVSHNCRKVATTDVALTTGNSLTVAMGVEAIRAGCRERGIDLAQARLAVVGATGNICSTYARIIADDVPEVVLVGRADSEARLAKVAQTLYADAWKRIITQRPQELTGLAKAIAETGTVRRLLGDDNPADPGAALFEGLKEEFGDHRFVRLAPGLEPLRECDVIVTATNSAEPVIFPEHLAAGPVVICDLAVPPDVSPAVARQRPDVVIVRGGIVRLPANPDLTVPSLPLPKGHLFACMAETTLLGLLGHREHFSFGTVEKADVEWIREVARKHGYRLGTFQMETAFATG